MTARHARLNLPDVESYADIASQPEPTLRELLEHESPQVRLQAAWALGSRKGQEFLGDIASRAGREPSAGVRQHFMIMLAGGKEKAAIATFAALDPDALVRAAACQYLARLVEPSDLPFILGMLNRPETAKAERFESPVGRLMAQLILVTPDYEGLTEEELLEESGHWLR
ncbi:hypothetical protein BE17_36700 [Sorangium cellulosum]|uniref:PBS lyase n=1 Tax=Sorangium cellulosum TaxID=56 RepID=A0A150RP15_SORCE|nr:hypothetical protein BE17_36700 [Sorangium cellulosum]